jgi:hypothetical protein
MAVLGYRGLEVSAAAFMDSHCCIITCGGAHKQIWAHGIQFHFLEDLQR